IGKLPRLDNVSSAADLDLPLQELFEQLHCQVTVRETLDLGQELVAENRDVGLLEPRGRKDVDDLLARGNRLRHELPDRLIEILGTLAVADLLEERHPDRLKEGHIIPDADRLGVGWAEG